MAKLTMHARERAGERFNIKEEEAIKILGAMASDPRQYTLIKVKGDTEYRYISFMGIDIVALVKFNRVITLISKENKLNEGTILCELLALRKENEKLKSIIKEREYEM